jgi:glycosyltransferase involved in cell wall biosynthesis
MPVVLMVDLARGYGGTSSRVFNLLSHFPTEQAALASLKTSEITRRAQALGLPVYVVGTHKTDPRIPGRLVRAIRHSGASVVDTHNIQSKLWGSLAAAHTRAALVSTLNSWYRDEHGANLKGRMYQGLERLTNRPLDLYISISQGVYDRLIESGIGPERIALIPNAVELDPAAVPGDKRWLCDTYNLPADALAACAVGRMVWAKGYSDLIQALERLNNPRLYVLIAGDGELRPDLEAQIRQAGLTDRIRLLGFTDHDTVLSIVKASDLFVMPSRSEGTPIALLEAAALARPILATRAGGIPELVTDGQHALLVSVGDSAGLADGFEHLLQNPDLAQRLGMCAREHVIENFSLSAQVKATQLAYARAIEHAQQRLA